MPELDTIQAKKVYDNISVKYNIGDYETYLSKMQDPVILFFGGYGIVHFASKPKKQFVKQLIRFAYLAIGSAALYLLFSSFFKGTLLLKVPYIYFLPAVAAVGYILFQLLYDMVIKEFFKNNYLSSLISDNNTSGI